MNGLRVGFALCGSFCTLDRVIVQMEALVESGCEVIPILSEAVRTVDTRFGTAASFYERITQICGRPPLVTLTEVEPLGPKDLIDVLVVAPCTGSTLSHLAVGDHSHTVSLAVKSHLRRERPVVLAVSTNDALSGSFGAIATLKNRKHIYLVPMRQDDPQQKPNSLVADFTRITDTILAALNGQQLQPLFL